MLDEVKISTDHASALKHFRDSIMAGCTRYGEGGKRPRRLLGNGDELGAVKKLSDLDTGKRTNETKGAKPTAKEMSGGAPLEHKLQKTSKAATSMIAMRVLCINV